MQCLAFLRHKSNVVEKGNKLIIFQQLVLKTVYGNESWSNSLKHSKMGGNTGGIAELHPARLHPDCAISHMCRRDGNGHKQTLRFERHHDPVRHLINFGYPAKSQEAFQSNIFSGDLAFANGMGIDCVCTNGHTVVMDWRPSEPRRKPRVILSKYIFASDPPSFSDIHLWRKMSAARKFIGCIAPFHRLLSEGLRQLFLIMLKKPQ